MAFRIARFLPGDRVPLEKTVFDEKAKKDKPVVCQVAKGLPVEAETGIGKTMAYLIPVCLYATLSGKRVAISTFTRFLQQEIESGHDIDVVLDLVFDLTGKRLKVALRRGISNFVSASRAVHLQEMFQKESPEFFTTDAGNHFLKFCDWAGKGRPFAEWDHEIPYGPDGNRIPEDSLCLRFDSPEEDKASYKEHVAAAKEADVVITTHMTVLMNARNGWAILGPDENEEEETDIGEKDGSSGNRPLSVLVADEADRLDSAAETLYSRKLRPPDILSFCKKIERLGLSIPEEKKIRLESEKAQNEMASIYKKLSSRSVSFMSLEPGEIDGFLSWVRTVRDKCLLLSKNEKVPKYLRFAAADYSADARVLLDHHKSSLKNPQIMLELSWSPIRHEPGIGSLLLNPGIKVSSLIYGVDRLVLTSGTLVMGNASDLDKDFRGRYGISIGIHEPVKENTFRPLSFGVLKSVVFADPSVPAPFVNANGEKNYDYHPEWIRYAVRMVARAVEGGRTLVLASSFRDIEAIEEQLSIDSSLCRIHRREMPFAEFWGKQVDGHEKVRLVVSPSPWEGANLRKGTGPWMENLLILRLPIPPVSETVLNYYREQEKDWAIHHRRTWETFRKFRQGLGRAFRKSDDTVSWWFADPRIPIPADFRILFPDMKEAGQGLPFLRQNGSFSSDGLQAIHAMPVRFRGILPTVSSLYLHDGTMISAKDLFVKKGGG